MNNKICELVGRLLHAPQVFMYRQRSGANQLEVIGAYGFHESHLPLDWHIPAIAFAKSRALAFRDTRVVPDLQEHPLVTSVPPALSLLVLKVPSAPGDGLIAMMIVNPEELVFTDHERMTAILLLVQMIGVRFNDEQLPTPEGFAENGNALVSSVAGTNDPSAAAFLLSTLPKKQRLLGRNNIAYTACRTWRANMKDFQIAALKTLKANASAEFAQTVAQEMAEVVVAQLGRNFIKNVVPVPCGSSGRTDCLSVRMAEELAKALDCRFANVLISKALPGSSHPKKSAKLPQFEVARVPKGATLVIDDVVTSGRHMELALNALRSKEVSCFAVAWIAA